MGEIKQTNFRVDQERADAFRAYCEANGINQAVGFERMLEALEMQNAKAAIPSRETEISEFERALRYLQAAYLNSLELNEQAEARIREEFARQLDTKDRTITDYQDQIAALKEEKKILAGAAEQVKQLQADLEAAREQAQKDRMAVADRDLTIKQLTANNEILQIKAEGYDAVLIKRDSLSQELRDLKKDHAIEMERAARDAEKAQEAAVAAVKAEGDAKVSELKEQLQDAKIASANALQEAERAAHEADRAASAEIRKLEQENARLREQLAEMKAKIPEETNHGVD